MLLGMSQERLGELLGLTFQQIQKYEKGSNRIGASRLFDIAKVLDVSIQYFFEGYEGAASVLNAESCTITNILQSKDGVDLSRAFARITQSSERRAIVALVEALAERRE
jgi:transcriptional regulator with XRE-family HTH domain